MSQPIMPSSKHRISQSQSVAVVSEQLKAYAQRGVFRSFSQTRADHEQAEFRFYWLWNLPFELSFNGRRREMSFKKLLPNIVSGSTLDADLKAFIKGRCSPDHPEHRRLDPKRVVTRYSNRRGTVSLAFQVMGNDYEYGVRKALNMVNEIFVGFLNVHYPEYMVENFRRPEE